MDTSMMENKQLKPHNRINSAVQQSTDTEKHMDTSTWGKHAGISGRRQWPTQADG